MRSLTYHQQIKDLAAYAESTIEVLNIDDETKKLIDEGCICTLFEGNAPFRPRYIFQIILYLWKRDVNF